MNKLNVTKTCNMFVALMIDDVLGPMTVTVTETVGRSFACALGKSSIWLLTSIDSNRNPIAGPLSRSPPERVTNSQRGTVELPSYKIIWHTPHQANAMTCRCFWAGQKSPEVTICMNL